MAVQPVGAAAARGVGPEALDPSGGNAGQPRGEGTPDFLTTPPAIALPKGGGAIRGLGERFGANPATGTGSLRIPIPLPPGRGGFGPALALNYDSVAGNGCFGIGWRLTVPSITRRTERGLPGYSDDDVFVLAGGEELVPADAAPGEAAPVRVHGRDYLIRRYLPRVDTLGTLIEHWTDAGDRGRVFWRTIDRDNVTTWFGRDGDSRVADPAEPARVFEWLACERHDDRGNAIVFGYVPEDARGVDVGATHERDRGAAARTAARYLKDVRYGNLVPHLPTLAGDDGPWPGPADRPGQSWMFRVVLDYGDHRENAPAPDPDRPWTCRADPFSTRRSRWEIRTHRLCRRILQFSSFPGVAGLGPDCLVRATELGYAEPGDLRDPAAPGYSVLTSITQRSFRRRAGPGGGYADRALPPLTFRYSRPVIDDTVRFIDRDRLENAPVGTEGTGYAWVDLDGDGLSGILSEAGGEWRYAENLGEARFGPSLPVGGRPVLAVAGPPRSRLIDLDGDGGLELVEFRAAAPGYQARRESREWGPFVPFPSIPNLDWDDPAIRFADLTGDGRADILTTRPGAIAWHPSLGGDGYGPAERSPAPAGEASGPRLLFADADSTVLLADMTGDGMSDLVRILPGSVTYWPSRGMGDFGPRVVMGNAPLLERPDRFDPRRVRLADIDGSGPADLLYLGDDGVRIHLNRSGDTFSDPRVLPLPAATDNVDAVQVADLLGTGTACLVWNSPSARDEARPVRYIDLMAGEDGAPRGNAKPHLLVGVDNGLGGRVEIEYAPSTRFSVEDRLAGRPWRTRLPFPVHCVTRITTRDAWRGTAFTSSMTWHEGCFDGRERRFRGFGRVEQVDVEEFGRFAAANAGSPWVTPDRTLYQPPVKTVTWFHLGAAQESRPEASPGGGPQGISLAGFGEKPLPPAALPDDVGPQERRDALVACAGRVIRQETYELDVQALAAAPSRHVPVRLYGVTAAGYRVRRIQARGTNEHAVFTVGARESLTYEHDLALPAAAGTADPRIAHTMVLRSDDLGGPEQTVTVAYGSRAPGTRTAGLPRADLIDAVQAGTHMAYTEERRTADVVVRAPSPAGPAAAPGAVVHHRRRLPCETLTYEVTGVVPAGGYHDLEDLRRHALCADGAYPPVATAAMPVRPVGERASHVLPPGPGPERRLTARARTRYFQDGDDVAQPVAPLPHGRHGPRGLRYEAYRLAFSDAHLEAVFTDRDPVTGAAVEDRLARRMEDADGPVRARIARTAAGGYVDGASLDSALAGGWWVRSGVAGFGPGARTGFYVPDRYEDPFGNTTTLAHDARRLFVRSATDPMGNVVTVEQFDHRVLAPSRLVDVSGNRHEVAYDILGRVAATAVNGARRADGSWEGDRLGDPDPDPADLDPAGDAVAAFCTSRAQDDDRARRWLGTATTRFVYHHGDGRDVAGRPLWAARPAAAVAIARERHSGSLAPGEESPLQVTLESSDGSGAVLMRKVQAEADPETGADRWVVNGLRVLNNKGNAVKEYEPSFSDRFGLETPPMGGVSPVRSYDAQGRLVRTDLPDGTLTRHEFSPWRVASWDRNDTVLESAWYTARGTHDPAEALPTDLAGRVTAEPGDRAAWLTARHAGTPQITLLDALGRAVVAVSHDRVEDPAGTHRFAGAAWADAHTVVFSRLDADGTLLWMREERGNVSQQHVLPAVASSPADTTDDWVAAESLPVGAVRGVDLLGNPLHVVTSDAGVRWTLPDASGAPMLHWDVNEEPPGAGAAEERRLSAYEYDGNRRCVARMLRVWRRAAGSAGPFQAGPPETWERTVHQDGVTPDVANLNGQAVARYDPGGVEETLGRDMDGNITLRRRTLLVDGTLTRADWDAAAAVRDSPLLEAEGYTEVVAHDALGRMATHVGWHLPGAAAVVYAPAYDRRGSLAGEDLVTGAATTAAGHVPGTGTRTTVVTGIAYDAAGRVLSVARGNGTLTEHIWDPLTQRPVQTFTTRPSRPATPAARDAGLADPGVLQDLVRTYDPEGNLVEIRDGAYMPVFWKNAIAEPRTLHEFDARYRLTVASGRETAAGGGGDAPAGAGFPVTGQTLRRYTRRHSYDASGNLVRVRHAVSAGPPGWTRDYQIAAASNRLAGTWRADDRAGTEVRPAHDLHGNMLAHGQAGPADRLRWDHRDLLRGASLGGGGTAWYQQDGTNRRIRARVERAGGDVEERVYLPGLDRVRRWVGGRLVEEVHTSHLFVGDERVLLVDDVRAREEPAPGTPAGVRTVAFVLHRHQYPGHLGSVAVEVDGTGGLLTYEEFHPHGTTAVRSSAVASEASAKRYRFVAAERDAETGLAHHGVRKYSPVLGRWVSPDPAGVADGPNRYAYARNNPVTHSDTNGLQTVGTLRGLAAVARRDQQQKFALQLHMKAHPEQYPNVTQADKDRLRAEIMALERTAGRLEAQADEDTDFRRNVALPFFLNLAVAAVTAPIAAVAWPVRALFAFMSGFGVGETIQGKTVSLKPDSFGQTKPLTGSDRVWHGVASTSGVVLSVAGEVQIARSGTPQLVKDPFAKPSGPPAGSAAVVVPPPVADAPAPTLGEIFAGRDPESMLHITPLGPGEFGGNAVDTGSFWARLEDVAHLTVEQFRRGVVAAGAPGHFPDATTFVVAPPGAAFRPSPAVGGAGYPEFVNDVTVPVTPANTVQVPPGAPVTDWNVYSDPRLIPPYRGGQNP